MARRSSVGKMRQRITIEKQSRSADGGGSEALTWTKLVEVYGHIQPQSGGERLFGDQLEERITHIITIRYRKDVSHKNRLKYVWYVGNVKNERIFNVKRVINRESMSKFLDILCEEGVAT